MLQSGDFYEYRHGLIWDAMALLFVMGSPIDILTVSDILENEGNLDKVGGELYFAHLSGEVATSAHVRTYAEKVKGLSRTRAVILESMQTAQMAYDHPIDVGEFLNERIGSMMRIAEVDRKSEILKISEVVPDVMSQIDRQANRVEHQVPGLETGFGDLDDMLGGLQDGELIIIAGRPSMGKTSLGVDMMRHQAAAGKSVLLFSLEMSSRQIALRVLSAEASINLHRLRQGKLSESDWKRLSNCLAHVNQFPFYIDDKSNIGVSEIISKAGRFVKDKGVKAIYLDYIGLMPQKLSNRVADIGMITRSLKSFGRDVGIPIVVLAQLNRGVENRGGDHIPVLSDLRDSGAIEQDADVVMFVHRRKQYKHGEAAERCDQVAEIIVRKQRNGPTGTVKLIFNEIYSRFDEIANKADIKDAEGFAHPQIPESDWDEPSTETPF